MNLGTLTRSSRAVMLFVMTASCYQGKSAPFPMSNDSLPLFNASPLHGGRDPCLDDKFQPPVYQFTDMVLSKDDWWESNGRYRFLTSFSFNLVDVPNGNRTLRCYWKASLGWWTWPRWEPMCHSLGPNRSAESRHIGFLNINPEGIALNQSARDPVGVIEYWFCGAENNGSFPQVYQSKAQIFVDAICPDKPVDGAWQSNCTITAVQFPLTAKVQWYTAGSRHPGTPLLEPRPNRPLPRSGLDPPPSKDCTDLSLVHPDWEVSGLVSGPDEVSFFLASRATGSRATCKYRPDNAIEESIRPKCSLQLNSSTESHSRFAVNIRGDGGRLSIQEDWVCGDTNGLYSTNFTAAGEVTIPTSSMDKPISIRGSLLKPIPLTPTVAPAPPNANTPSCTAFSNNVFWRSTWGISHFLYEAEQRATLYASSDSRLEITDPIVQRNLAPYSRKLELTLINYANNYTTSCSLDDPLLDNSTATVWFACPPASAGGRATLHTYPHYAIHTYIQLDRDTATFRLNQTYYCNDTGTPYEITARGQTSGPYSIFDSGNRLICGSGSNIARNIVCMRTGFGPSIACDLFITKRWCSLDGSRDGEPIMGYAGGITATSFERRELPGNALTSPDPDPEITSCTLASLGGRGPVVWTLRPTKKYKFLSLTYFPPEYSELGELGSTHPWKQTEGFPTRLAFDMSSSVFPDTFSSSSSPSNNNPDKSRGTGVIRNIGTIEDDYAAGQGRLFLGSNLTLTPWLNGPWDPTAVYQSPVTMADRFSPERGAPLGETRRRVQVEAGGWDFYNALDWKFKMDLASGYMELNHSWYCDDLNSDQPIIFNGTWNGYLPLNCSFNFERNVNRTDQSGIVCYLTGESAPGDGSVDVTPSVTYNVINYTIPDPRYDFG